MPVGFHGTFKTAEAQGTLGADFSQRTWFVLTLWLAKWVESQITKTAATKTVIRFSDPNPPQISVFLNINVRGDLP